MYRHFQHLAVGENHRRKGSVTDDRAALVNCRKSLVMVVADGAGSADFGGCGAETAVQAVTTKIRLCRKRVRNTERFIWQLFAEARKKIVGIAGKAERSVHDYATTLIIVVLTPRKVTVGRVGDGCVVAASPDGDLRLLSAATRPGPTNVTQFLTDEDWQQNLVIDCLKRPRLAIAAFTDGIEHQVICGKTNTPHTKFFEPVFRSLRTRGPLPTGELVQRVFKEQIAERSGDDMTIIVASPEDLP
jgi:hypothetical protein